MSNITNSFHVLNTDGDWYLDAWFSRERECKSAIKWIHGIIQINPIIINVQALNRSVYGWFGRWFHGRPMTMIAYATRRSKIIRKFLGRWALWVWITTAAIVCFIYFLGLWIIISLLVRWSIGVRRPGVWVLCDVLRRTCARTSRHIAPWITYLLLVCME